MDETRKRPRRKGKEAGPDLHFYTIENVADRLEVCPRSVRRWIKAGLLPAYRFGTAKRILDTDFLNFVAARREPNT